MSNIIDRRLNPRDKNVKNRQKFLQRTRDQIKRVVKDSIDSGNIADIQNGKIRVKAKGIDEPTFGTDSTSGNKRYVMPGNDKYVPGDIEEKSQGGEGGRGSKGSADGRHDDEFEFSLNRDEYLDFIFEDLELPDLVKKQIKDVTRLKPQRAGFTNVGNPSQLDVVRSLKNSIGRRIGLKRPKNDEIAEAEQQLALAEAANDHTAIAHYTALLDELRRKQRAIPWLDPFDVRYRNFTMNPQPVTKAVMFCVMDVSGSMTQREKDLAKRFFFLLHLFLNRKYERVDIVFIRHHDTAAEVDEQEFFYGRESGGTIVSSAIELTINTIKKRYSPTDWNIYVAQASDGDNWSNDEDAVTSAMQQLLPMVQYYAYVEIRTHLYNGVRVSLSDLWETYERLADQHAHMNMKQVTHTSDIWRVFKELFSKERA